MARAHQLLSLDESIGDPAAVVGAFVVHDDQPAAPQARHRDPTRADARRHHCADRELTDSGPWTRGAAFARRWAPIALARGSPARSSEITLIAQVTQVTE